jgi:hypothetical protein
VFFFAASFCRWAGVARESYRLPSFVSLRIARIWNCSKRFRISEFLNTHNITYRTQEKRKSAATTMQQGAIPVGSYIIQCVHGGPEFTGGRRGVLHRKTRSNELIVAERDEEAEREDQTFWIEPIPEFKYDEKETNLIYQITHLASGELVEVPNGSHDIGQPLRTWIQNGTPAQMWRFIRMDESKDGGYMSHRS